MMNALLPELSTCPSNVSTVRSMARAFAPLARASAATAPRDILVENMFVRSCEVLTFLSRRGLVRARRGVSPFRIISRLKRFLRFRGREGCGEKRRVMNRQKNLD